MAETTLQPDPTEWWRLLERPAVLPLAEQRQETRLALDLPSDRLVIATGHQAAIWHPGILAKDLAAATLARSLDSKGIPAVPLHFIADHDANDAGLLDYPTRAMRRSGWRMLPAGSGRCTRDRRPATPTAPPTDAFPETSIETGLQTIHEAVLRHTDAPNLAWQLGQAASDLARPYSGPVRRRSMSELLDTPIGHLLLDRIARDPEACVVAHDLAVESDRRARAERTGRLPRAMVRPLRNRAVDELPLWRDSPGGRRPVLVGEPLDPRTCRPRALLATALTRLGACDLFIHGTGGGLYDRVMECWLDNWLGSEVEGALAPAVVATATLRLPLDAGTGRAPHPDCTPEGLHRLRSDPDLGRTAPPVRPRLLQAIEEAPRGSRERYEAYQVLRAEVALARDRGRDRIEAYRSALEESEEHRRRLGVARDRTWPFPLHASAVLKGLADSITRSLDSEGSLQASSNGRGR